MVKVQKMYLTPDQWARPQDKLKGVEALVWHWVANPNSSAVGNRNYFENRTGSYGSAHYIVGLQGEKIQCLPEDEMGYHVGSHVYTKRSLRELGSYPNNNTIGIECTHIDWNGKMKDETYEALIELSVDILKRHNLTADDIWLHQEVVGWKDCHRWFVNNQDEYRKAKEEVAKRLGQKAPKPPVKTDPKDVDMPELNSNGEYVVQKGDTLWAISRAFDVTVDQLEKLNPNVKAKALKIGSKIKVKEKVQHVSKPKPQPSKPKPDMKTNSIVTYLNSIGEDSSYGNRAKLAKKHGIKGYNGSAQENTLLLSILRDGKKAPSQPKPKKSITQMAQLVIDGKAGNGHSNRQKFLGISDSEYAKVRAEVNRILSGKSKPAKPKKSISQMADEVIRGLHGSGHSKRRKSLGISLLEYNKVRKEVNRRL